MRRPLGVLSIAVASFLCGLLAWFCLIWLISVGANLTRAPAFEISMIVLSPHMANTLVDEGLV